MHLRFSAAQCEQLRQLIREEVRRALDDFTENADISDFVENDLDADESSDQTAEETSASDEREDESDESSASESEASKSSADDDDAVSIADVDIASDSDK